MSWALGVGAVSPRWRKEHRPWSPNGPSERVALGEDVHGGNPATSRRGGASPGGCRQKGQVWAEPLVVY